MLKLYLPGAPNVGVKALFVSKSVAMVMRIPGSPHPAKAFVEATSTRRGVADDPAPGLDWGGAGAGGGTKTMSELLKTWVVAAV